MSNEQEFEHLNLHNCIKLMSCLYFSYYQREMKFESRQYLLSEKLLVDVDIKFKKSSPPEVSKIKKTISQESHSKHDQDDNDSHNNGDSIKNKKNKCCNPAFNEPYKSR